MRRFIAATLIALTIGIATPANAKWNWQGPCDGWRYGETVTQDTPRFKVETRMKRLIVCAFDRYAPGNTSKALYVAGRESGYWPWAINQAYDDAHDCIGLFQHMRRYWPSRVKAYLWAGWYPAADWPYISAKNPHANAIAAAKMVKAGGWAPWSTG